MNYSIKVVKFKDGKENVKAFVSVVFGKVFKVTNIKIMENSKNGTLFVSMPQYKTKTDGKTVYKDIFNPVTKEFREQLYTDILDTFKKLSEEKSEQGEYNFNRGESVKFSVKVIPYKKKVGNLRAFVHICFNDSFAVNTANILQGKQKLFISMPSYKTKKKDDNGKEIYQEICYPVTKDFREQLYSQILSTYEKTSEEF